MGDHDFFTAGTDAGLATIMESGGTSLAMNFMTNVAEDNAVAAAGNLPAIRIMSSGSHPNDTNPGPIPTVIEGQRYTVAQKFIVPDPYTVPATNDKISYGVAGKLVYTYPTSAIKGYGVFDNNALSGSTNKFTGPPTDALNTKVQVGTFTPQDQTEDHANGDFSFIDTFYWGPAASGPQKITLTAYFFKYVNGVRQPVQVSATDSVQVDVLRPTGNINAVMGQPGLQGNAIPSYGLDTGSLYYPDRKSRLRDEMISGVSNSVYGIVFNATVSPTATDRNSNAVPISGQSVLGQTTQSAPVRNYVGRDGQNHSEKLIVPGDLLLPAGQTSTILDNSFPFGRMLAPNNSSLAVPLTAPVGSTLKKSDSPFSRLIFPDGIPVSAVRTDSFTTTLYYQQTGGIYVPVGSVKWGWGGTVIYTNGRINANASSFSRDPVKGDPTYQGRRI